LYHAGLAALVAIFALYAVQIGAVLVGAPVLAAVGASEIAAIAVVVVAERRHRGLAGVVVPSVRFFGAAALVGCGVWFIALVVVALLFDQPDNPGLRHLVVDAPIPPTVLVVAILPAIAEELIFRGLLARALAARFGAAIGVVASAIGFALFHLNPLQMPSALLLGLALGWIAVRARSVLPVMIAHALHNSIVAAVARDTGIRHFVARNPWPMLATCGALVALGIAIAAPEARA
jgi:membrane protease YdiL (CAAX protease family)